MQLVNVGRRLTTLPHPPTVSLSPAELRSLSRAAPVPFPFSMGPDEARALGHETLAECVRTVTEAGTAAEATRLLREWSRSLSERTREMLDRPVVPVDARALERALEGVEEGSQAEADLFADAHADLFHPAPLDFRRAVVDRFALAFETYGRRSVASASGMLETPPSIYDADPSEVLSALASWIDAAPDVPPPAPPPALQMSDGDRRALRIAQAVRDLLDREAGGDVERLIEEAWAGEVRLFHKWAGGLIERSARTAERTLTAAGLRETGKRGERGSGLTSTVRSLLDLTDASASGERAE